MRLATVVDGAPITMSFELLPLDGERAATRKSLLLLAEKNALCVVVVAFAADEHAQRDAVFKTCG